MATYKLCHVHHPNVPSDGKIGQAQLDAVNTQTDVVAGGSLGRASARRRVGGHRLGRRIRCRDGGAADRGANAGGEQRTLARFQRHRLRDLLAQADQLASAIEQEHGEQATAPRPTKPSAAASLAVRLVVASARGGSFRLRTVGDRCRDRGAAGTGADDGQRLLGHRQHLARLHAVGERVLDPVRSATFVPGDRPDLFARVEQAVGARADLARSGSGRSAAADRSRCSPARRSIRPGHRGRSRSRRPGLQPTVPVVEVVHAQRVRFGARVGVAHARILERERQLRRG